MFLINIVEYILQIDFMIWLFGAFGFLGINFLLQKLIFGGSK